MRYIKLTNSRKRAIVDDEWYESLKGFKWSLSIRGYAQSAIGLMHRMVNRTPKGLVTDHINGNKLDNRHSNLRSLESEQNTHIARKRALPIGVTYINDGRPNPYLARCTYKGEVYRLGQFKSPEDAHHAYVAFKSYTTDLKKYHKGLMKEAA